MTGSREFAGVEEGAHLVELPKPGQPVRMPNHVAFIMDGNGRWAGARGLSRSDGHRAGAEAAQRALEACLEAGIPFTTFFALSTENWRRPADEIGGILSLLRERLDAVRRSIPEGVRIRFVGDHSRLDGGLRRRMREVEERTRSGTRMLASIAIGYGGRRDIVAAARTLAQRVASGEILPEDIDETLFASALETRGAPDPDLVIRTGGEYRMSNFLLWQSAYAEFVSLQCYWPDFGASALDEALRDFAARERRFGGHGSSLMRWRSELAVRILSGTAIAVPCLFAIYLGGIWLVAIASLAAALLSWEWRRLTAPAIPWRNWAFSATCALAPWASLLEGWPAVLGLAGVAALLGGAGRSLAALAWSASGALAAGVAPAALVLLRDGPDGLGLVSWIVSVVVASDVGAYAIGRAIGGPRLAPRISPGKTWSGCLGGLATAGTAGALVGSWFTLLEPASLLLLSLAAGVTAQAGDLGASALKRRAGVKDSGQLIPGHGGFMDRFDSLVAVILAAAFIVSVVGIAPSVH